MIAGPGNKRTSSEAEESLSPDPTQTKQTKVDPKSSNPAVLPGSSNPNNTEADRLETQMIARARSAGYSAGKNGTPLPKYEDLVRRYNAAGAIIYRETYIRNVEEYLGKKYAVATHDEIQTAIAKRRAHQTGIESANRGVMMPSDSELERKYKENASNYKEGYNSVHISPEKAANRRAYESGVRNVLNGGPLKTRDELIIENGYTIEQAREYIKGYNRYKGTPEEHEERRIRRNKASNSKHNRNNTRPCSSSSDRQIAQGSNNSQDCDMDEVRPDEQQASRSDDYTAHERPIQILKSKSTPSNNNMNIGNANHHQVSNTAVLPGGNEISRDLIHAQESARDSNPIDGTLYTRVRKNAHMAAHRGYDLLEYPILKCRYGEKGADAYIVFYKKKFETFLPSGNYAEATPEEIIDATSKRRAFYKGQESGKLGEEMISENQLERIFANNKTYIEAYKEGYTSARINIMNAVERAAGKKQDASSAAPNPAPVKPATQSNSNDDPNDHNIHFNMVDDEIADEENERLHRLQMAKQQNEIARKQVHEGGASDPQSGLYLSRNGKAASKHRTVQIDPIQLEEEAVQALLNLRQLNVGMPS